MLDIVLYQPEIPPNTGNIIRLCANTGFALHLIRPLGFDLDDKKLRRAGLDYREFQALQIYDDWEHYRSTKPQQVLYGLSTKGYRSYADVTYCENDALVFGPETRGLPRTIRTDIGEQQLLKLPMLANSRSLNLSNATAIVAYEAWRQLHFLGGQI